MGQVQARPQDLTPLPLRAAGCVCADPSDRLHGGVMDGAVDWFGANLSLGLAVQLLPPAVEGGPGRHL